MSGRHRVCLVSNKHVNHGIEIVKEGQEVKGHFGPSFVDCVVKGISVHNGCRVVEAGFGHSSRTLGIAPHVINQQRDVKDGRGDFA